MNDIMEYQATAKYIRTSTRKLRLIVDAIKPLRVVEALSQLEHMPKMGASAIAKVLESAVSNAKQKNVQIDALTFKRVDVMGGPVMKRFHAVSRGQAHSYKKRMTHVRVVLTDETKEVKQKVVKEDNGTKN